MKEAKRPGTSTSLATASLQGKFHNPKIQTGAQVTLDRACPEQHATHTSWGKFTAQLNALPTARKFSFEGLLPLGRAFGSRANGNIDVNTHPAGIKPEANLQTGRHHVRQ
jgi:hypothetical protein